MLLREMLLPLGWLRLLEVGLLSFLLLPQRILLLQSRHGLTSPAELPVHSHRTLRLDQPQSRPRRLQLKWLLVQLFQLFHSLLRRRLNQNYLFQPQLQMQLFLLPLRLLPLLLR
jgi:hypothetical protein